MHPALHTYTYNTAAAAALAGYIGRYITREGERSAYILHVNVLAKEGERREYNAGPPHI